LAAAYNLNTQYASYCQTATVALFSQPTVPAKSYFLAVGLKRSYGAALSKYPEGPQTENSAFDEKDFFMRSSLELGSTLNNSWTQAVVAGSAGAAGVAAFAGAQTFFASRTLGQTVLPYAYRSFYRAVASGARALENAQYLRQAAQSGLNISDAEPAITAADAAADAAIPEVAEGAAVAATGAFEAAATPGLLAAGGPAAVLAVFLEIGIEAVMDFQKNQQNLDDLATLDSDLTTLMTTPPNIQSFVGDDTGEYKLAATLVAASLPLSTTQTVAIQQGDGHLVFLVSASGQPTFTTRSFAYAGWNGLSEAAALNGHWFSERDTIAGLPHVNSLVPLIHFLDWNGRQWWAARFGDQFLVTKHGKENGGSDTYSDIGGCLLSSLNPTALFRGAYIVDDVYAPQLSNKGHCSSFVTPALHVKDPSGKNLTVQLAALPDLGSASASVTFQPGVTKIYYINATGLPTPAITLQGNLPAGFKFSDGGRGQAVIIDTNTTSKGSPPVSLTVTAANSVGSARQTILLTEKAGSALPSIEGPSSATIQGGQPFSLSFHLAVPNLVSYAASSNDPFTNSSDALGVTFSDDGKGNLTLSGVPHYLSGPSPAPVTGTLTITAQVQFKAANTGITEYENIYKTVQYTYTGEKDPAFTVSGPINWYAGQQNQYIATPSPLDAAADFNVIDNQALSSPCNAPNSANTALRVTGHATGNGTLTFTGNVPLPQDAPYTCSYIAQWRIPGDTYQGINKSFYTRQQTFNFNIISLPTFTSADVAPLAADKAGSFAITTQTSSTISASGNLPQGVTFSTGSGGATIAGTPAAGTGGAYPIVLASSSSQGTAKQNLTVTVDEAPAITSKNVVNVPLNQPASFKVTTSGYPNKAPDPALAMTFNVANPYGPAISFSNLDSAQNYTGTLALTIPPDSRAQKFELSVTAKNRVAASARQDLIIRYYVPGDANGDGQVNCRDVANIEAAIKGLAPSSVIPFLDLNNDGIVDAKDLALVTQYLPPGTTCH
jgi:hypothetical protein